METSRTSRSVVVSNIPELNKNKLEDKLEIHFGKRGNGGGDVDQVVITEQCGVIGTFALITFAEKETVASVLKRQHIFFGKTLTVEPHSSTEEEQRNVDQNTPKKIKLSRLPQLPSQDCKLIIHGPYADNVIQSTAEITNVTLQVDEKSTKFCLEGPPSAIVQAVDILGKHNTETKTQPHGSGDVGQRKSVANWKTSLEGHEHRTEELIADKEALDTISVVEKYSDADPLKNDSDIPVTRRKDVPKLRQKRNIHPADTKKLPRNIAKFDPKILNYIHAIQHRVITEAGDRFGVNFEAKANGEVEFKSRGQNTDQQRINESMKFLETLVNSIQKKGFVTEMVRLMQFKEAPKQKVDEAVQQTLKSTDVLVTLNASNTLEFFGTEQSVHHEIEKLRAGILGRELQTDSQSSIEQTVYNQTDGDGIHRPQEEMGSMAMVGNFRAKNYSKHPERLASLDEDITDEASSVQGLQFKKSVVAPARKPLVRPLVTPEGSSVLDDVQFSCVENLVNGETYLPPEGPPTWKEESYPSLWSVTHNEICYPPNEAKQENQASRQSCHRVDLTTYFNAESAPNEQDTISVDEKNSDAEPLKNDNDIPVTRRKDVPKLRQKRNIHPADTKKLPRNIAKFDPKILNYIQAIQHRVITEAGDRFGVNFEAKANGEVEFKSRGQNTDQQRINESMKFLETLVNSIQKKGFVTEMVRLMQFKEAPKQKVDEAVQQTLKSTDVLVILNASNTLEFFGTEQSVHHEIEKLRAGILGRELQTDSQSSIEQTVYNQTDGDGIHRPQEEMGSMAMVGNFRAKNYSKHPERLASLDEDITDRASSVQGLQFKKSVVAPARKPLVRPLVTPEGSSFLGDVQFSCVENLVNGETYLPPPSLGSVTYNEIRYPPNEAEQENQVSKQSCHRVDLTTYFNAESALSKQDRSSDIVSEQDVKTAKPKVTFVYMNQEAYSPPVQHSRLLGATQDQDDGKDSRSRHDDDEVDGAGAFFVTNGAMGEALDMESSPRCVPCEESSSGTDSHMEIDSIVPVTTSAAVPSPWDFSLFNMPPVDHSLGFAFPAGISMAGIPEIDSIVPVTTSAAVPIPWDFSLFNMPPVDHSLGFASPAGISMAGIPDLYDIVNRSEDFTVAIRTGMKVIIRHGDITDEFTDVIVTSADRHLHHKNGVGRAVREAAGPELVRACQHWTQRNGPVNYGKNVWTVGGNLKCSHVLHVVLRQSQGGTELKSTLMDLLKTCAHSLQASNVSMPAIGAERMSVSKKVWARAFFEAVCEITQLYDKGWIQLTTLVLVDRNRGLLSEVKRVFEDPILSKSLGESFQNVRQESFFPGMSNGFTGSDACSVPGFRARGSSGTLNGASRKGFGKTQSVNRSSYQTSTRKDSSGVKSAFMDDQPVDEDHKCAICLGRITNKKKLRCNHSFCRGCLDTALKVHKYCPLCKQPIK